MRRARRNPELLILGNPPRSIRGKSRGSRIFGKEVDSIRYMHITEGARVHKFTSNGVLMEALPDGSIRIFHPRLRIWEDM